MFVGVRLGLGLNTSQGFLQKKGAKLGEVSTEI